jgi:aspartate aminotransferase-like enzyme
MIRLHGVPKPAHARADAAATRGTQALARDMIAHRGPEFAAVLHDCIDGLQWAFQNPATSSS